MAVPGFGDADDLAAGGLDGLQVAGAKHRQRVLPQAEAEPAVACHALIHAGPPPRPWHPFRRNAGRWQQAGHSTWCVGLLPHQLWDVLAEPGAPILGHGPFVADLAQDGQHRGVRVGVALDGTARGRAVVAVGPSLVLFLAGGGSNADDGGMTARAGPVAVPFLPPTLRGVGILVRFEGAHSGPSPACDKIGCRSSTVTALPKLPGHVEECAEQGGAVVVQ